MAVQDGQRADETTFNEAFLSRTTDSDTVAVVGLNNPGSGDLIPNAQQKINDIQTQVTSNDDDIATLFSDKQDLADKDQPNGYPGLDANGQILLTAMPVGSVIRNGNWDASTNTPVLADGGAFEAGDQYYVNVAGTQDLGSGSLTFAEGDTVTYSAAGIWEKQNFAGANNIGDLIDVDTTTNPPTSDLEVLSWDATAMKWVPKVAVAQENVAWVPQGTGTWDATTFDFVLSDDCFLSVPPLPNSYHTILAQTLNFASDGDVAYITIDRQAASTTNLTVTVTPITSFINDGNNIIIARRVGAELFIGIHDPQRFQDGDEFDLSKGGGGFSEAIGEREIATIEGLRTVASNTDVQFQVGTVHKDTKSSVVGDTFVAQKTTRYEINAYLSYGNSSTSGRFFNVHKNGSNLARILSTAGTPSTFTGQDCHYSLDLVAGDVLTFFFRQSTGSNENCSALITIKEVEPESNAVSNTELQQVAVSAICDAGAQGIPSGIVTQINLVPNYDPLNTIVGNQFIAPRAGSYSVNMGWGHTNNPPGASTMIIYLFKNSSNTKNHSLIMFTGATNWNVDMSHDIFLEAGDTIEMRGFQNTGSNATLDVSATYFSVSSNPNFTTYGVLNPETEYLETIYSDGTGNLSSPAVYVSPGPSAFDLPLTAGKWDVGYFVTMIHQSTGGTGEIITKAALHVDGVLQENSTTYSMTAISTTSQGNAVPMSNKIEITLASSATISLRFQAFSPASTRNRLVSESWTGAIGGADVDSAPKIWARRIG